MTIRVIILYIALFIALPVMADSYNLTIPISGGRILRIHQPAKTIFIADNNIADVQIKESNVLYISAKKMGKTVLYVMDDHGHILVKANIHVVINLESLRRAIAAITTSHITVREINDSIMLTGRVSSPQIAAYIRELAVSLTGGDEKKVIDFLKTTSSAQIYLRVKVVELKRTISRLIGLNDWQILYRTAGVTILGANQPILSDIFDVNNRFNVGAFFETLDRDGLVTILAEPNLVALSGKRASFLAGGEFPIVVPQSQFGVFTTTFQRFGVSLDFIPILLDKDTINLQVQTEDSELSDVAAIRIDSISIPSLTVRRADTTVQLKSGQSFAIAGLIQNNMRTAIRRFPALGRIPVLGALFRSREFQQDESELVIIVTAYIVRPTTEPLATPLDGVSTQEIYPERYHRNNNIQYILE